MQAILAKLLIYIHHKRAHQGPPHCHCVVCRLGRLLSNRHHQQASNPSWVIVQA